MSVGVYKMTFTGTDEFYIGSTGVSFNHRWHRHNLDLEAKKHKNRIVQNYYNKYGQPKFEVIENIKKFNGSVFKTFLLEREQYYLNILNPKLNVCPIAGSSLGRYYPPLSEEHKRKIGEAGKGRIATKETREKISNGNKGKVVSKEARERMSKSHTGKILTEEHRKNIGLVNKGVKRPPFTVEHRRKIGEASKGRIAWNKDIPRSEKVKSKIRLTIKKNKMLKEIKQNHECT